MQVPRYQGPAPHVLKRDTSEEKGEEARMSSFIGALALCDLVKTTLGPKVCVCVCVHLYYVVGDLRTSILNFDQGNGQNTSVCKR